MKCPLRKRILEETVVKGNDSYKEKQEFFHECYEKDCLAWRDGRCVRVGLPVAELERVEKENA